MQMLSMAAASFVASSRSLPSFFVFSRNCFSLGKMSELVLLVVVLEVDTAAVVPD